MSFEKLNFRIISYQFHTLHLFFTILYINKLIHKNFYINNILNVETFFVHIYNLMSFKF